MTKKRKKKRIRTEFIMYLCVSLAIIGGFVFFLTRGGSDKELKNLGYSPAHITVIKNEKLAKTFARCGKSSLMVKALNEDINNIRFHDYFLIADDALPKGYDADNLYDALLKLKDKYSAEETKLLIKEISSEEISALYDHEKIEDIKQLISYHQNGYTVNECLRLMEAGNNQVSEADIKVLTSKGYSKEDAEIIGRLLSKEDVSLIMSADKTIPELRQLALQEGFNIDLLPRYLMQVRDQKLSYEEAVAKVNGNGDYIPESEIDWSALYHDEKQAANYDSYTACINKQNFLPEDYEPSDLVDLPYGYYGNYHPMRKAAADALVAMSDAAVNAGYDRIIGQSNYRSYSKQKGLYEGYASWDGYANADRYSARPGFSEHQTGLVCDVATYYVSMDYFDTYKGYDWVMENAHTFGFIQRYPIHKEYLTGYEYESWHFRYVGVQPATIMYQHGWTLEEYTLLFD